jgi:hypothetical protein
MGSRGGGADAWETASARSGVSSSSSGRATAAAAAPAPENKVFVALPAQHKSGRSTLAWALRHVAELAPAAIGGGGEVVVVAAHVHSPAQMIPISSTCVLPLLRLLSSSLCKPPRHKLQGLYQPFD